MTEAASVKIENLSELADVTHKCTSQELLTDIRISQARTEETIINLSNFVQELSGKFESLIQSGHKCYQDEQVRRNTAAIEYLKGEVHRWQGQRKWEDRLWNIGQAVLVAVIVALVLWFMKGGQII